MTYSTTAIFENGVLKPTTPLVGIPEHTIVKISVEPLKPLSTEEKLAMLRAVPVAEELAAAIEEGRKRPWKVEEF